MKIKYMIKKIQVKMVTSDGGDGDCRGRGEGYVVKIVLARL